LKAIPMAASEGPGILPDIKISTSYMDHSAHPIRVDGTASFRNSPQPVLQSRRRRRRRAESGREGVRGEGEAAPEGGGEKDASPLSPPPPPPLPLPPPRL
jgi:hypothetical protein